MRLGEKLRFHYAHDVFFAHHEEFLVMRGGDIMGVVGA